MFSNLRDPHTGRPSLLLGGVALVLLSGMALLLPVPSTLALLLGSGTLLAGLACIGTWWRRKREDRYDLNRLFDAPPPEPEEPFEETVPEGEEAAPYCGWCNEVYRPGTHRCPQCGRDL